MSTYEETDPVGDVADVFQESEPPSVNLTVPVVVTGPVETHDVPSVSGGMRSRTILAVDQALKISGADRRRRSVRVWGDQPFWIGVDQASVIPSGTPAVAYAAKVPTAMLVTITHADEVWVKASADMTLSYIVENWAS